MARLAKFSLDQIVDATARVAAQAGPAQATMARIAGELQAPTGSIYHRFASRDVLLGEVWLRAAESFQGRFMEIVAGDDPWQAGLEGALFVPQRVREKPEEARILLLHRRDDFLTSGWPAEMAVRAAALKKSGEASMRGFAKRLLGRTDAAAMRAVIYVLVDAPLAAVQPHLRKYESPPAFVDPLIEATYVAVMTRAGARAPAKSRRKRS